jgi:hypothetical protein
MCHKPKYTRAVIRAMASGQPEVAAHVTAFQGRINAIICSTMREGEGEMTSRQLMLATLLQEIWFASLVAWSAGILSQSELIAHMNQAIELLILASPKSRSLRMIESR